MSLPRWLSMPRCTSRQTIAWLVAVVVLAALATPAGAQSGAGTAAAVATGDPGMVAIGAIVDHYGPWGAVLYVGARMLGVADRALREVGDWRRALESGAIAPTIRLRHDVDMLDIDGGG